VLMGMTFEAHAWSQRNINLNAYFPALREKEKRERGRMSQSKRERGL